MGPACSPQDSLEPRDEPISSVLPHTRLSRCMLLLVNLLLISGTVCAMRLLIDLRPPRDVYWLLAYYLAIELLAFFLAVCVLSFVWAAARPRWIARVFDGLYLKFLLVAFTVAVFAWAAVFLPH